jgi:hypothetical protein
MKQRVEADLNHAAGTTDTSHSILIGLSLVALTMVGWKRMPSVAAKAMSLSAENLSILPLSSSLIGYRYPGVKQALARALLRS